MNHWNREKSVNFIYGIAIFLVFGVLLYLGISDNNEITAKRENAGCQIVEDYQVIQTEDADAPIGVHKEYSWVMPQRQQGECCLAFYVVHQYVHVYLDEELVYSLVPDEKLLFGKTTGSNWVMIPLYPEDAGKTIKVVVTPVYESFRNWKPELLVGSSLQIYTQRLKKDLPQLIIGSIAVLAGIVFIIMSAASIVNKKSDNSLAALGTFSLMLGLWRLTDTRFSPFMMPEKTIFLYYVSLGMLMVGSVPLLKSIRHRFDKKFSLLFDYCCLISGIVCIVQIVLQVVGIKDLRETLIYTHMILVICVLLSASAMIHDWIKHGWKKMSGLGKGVFMVCVAGVAGDVTAFYVKGNSSGLLFTLTAFLTYIIVSGVVSIWGFVEQERKMKEQEAELATSRISIMLSQIQPHFLYNSLNTIYHLCEKNPAAARKAISDFSDYLRGNLDSLKRVAPIGFEKELEHVKIYLSLEKMRFDEELEIVYDIETTTFLIPALTVQPLVENAVKHGLFKAEKGGTLTISTRETKDSYEVIVTDDGVGYDVNEVEEDGRTHVGIENVRRRLWEMSRATLEIFSEKGCGTRAVIKLPKEGMADENPGS